MVNSLVGYIALLRQLASFCKGWVGDRSINKRKISQVMTEINRIQHLDEACQRNCINALVAIKIMCSIMK